MEATVLCRARGWPCARGQSSVFFLVRFQELQVKTLDRLRPLRLWSLCVTVVCGSAAFVSVGSVSFVRASVAHVCSAGVHVCVSVMRVPVVRAPVLCVCAHRGP